MFNVFIFIKVHIKYKNTFTIIYQWLLHHGLFLELIILLSEYINFQHAMQNQIVIRGKIN